MQQVGSNRERKCFELCFILFRRIFRSKRLRIFSRTYAVIRCWLNVEIEVYPAEPRIERAYSQRRNQSDHQIIYILISITIT